MKKILLFITTIFTLIILSLTFLFFSIYPQIKPCFNPSDFQQISTCLTQLPQTKKTLTSFNKIIHLGSVDTLLSLISTTEPLLPYQNYFLGQDQPTTYLILLQNDTELRANGGFFGSYAILTLDKSQPSIRFQDIYVPDGQIQGHIDPPEPIQQAFRQGWFRLRDSDWDPNFPTTSTTIRWFFNKGNEIVPDNIITLPLSIIQDILKITGPLQVPEYNLTLESDNIFINLQNLVEQDFFPGSTQKKDVLTSTGNILISQLSSLTPQQYLDIIDILLTDLDRQNILLNSTQPEIQTVFSNHNWAGELKPSPCLSDNCLSDTLAIIEANLGANKANYYLSRHTTHQIDKESQLITHQITIDYTNNSPHENPQPPEHFGGNYINYLRFYLPSLAQNITLSAEPTLPLTLDYFPEPIISSSPLPLSSHLKHDFLQVGFFHITRADSNSTLTLSYQLPITNYSSYQFTLLKQHGLRTSPQTIKLFSQSHSTNLEQDLILQTPLP